MNDVTVCYQVYDGLYKPLDHYYTGCLGILPMLRWRCAPENLRRKKNTVKSLIFPKDLILLLNLQKIQ
jgi:hypothetical protein